VGGPALANAPLAAPASAASPHGGRQPREALLQEEVDRRPHPGIGVVPAHPARIRQRRRDGHVGQFGHQPGEHLRVARGHVRRVAGPELLGVHSQRTGTDYRRERPGTWKPAPGQPGLRRDTRHGPAVIGARLDHDLRTAGQPQTEHHRDLLQLAGLEPVGPGVCEVHRWMAGTGGEPAGKPVYALAAVGVKSR
jgi:hypothetical protein